MVVKKIKKNCKHHGDLKPEDIYISSSGYTVCRICKRFRRYKERCRDSYLDRKKVHKIETPIRKIYCLVYGYFETITDGDVFMKTKCPLLGDQSPLEIIKLGREKKLLQFIENTLEGNNP